MSPRPPSGAGTDPSIDAIPWRVSALESSHKKLAESFDGVRLEVKGLSTTLKIVGAALSLAIMGIAALGEFHWRLH